MKTATLYLSKDEICEAIHAAEQSPEPSAEEWLQWCNEMSEAYDLELVS